MRHARIASRECFAECGGPVIEVPVNEGPIRNDRLPARDASRVCAHAFHVRLTCKTCKHATFYFPAPTGIVEVRDDPAYIPRFHDRTSPRGGAHFRCDDTSPTGEQGGSLSRAEVTARNQSMPLRRLILSVPVAHGDYNDVCATVARAQQTKIKRPNPFV